jgi:hypothetical protein
MPDEAEEAGEAEDTPHDPRLWSDRKNPQPLDSAAFDTLVTTVLEVNRGHGRHVHAWLPAVDAFGEELARHRMAPRFVLNAARAAGWVAGGFGPG